MIAIEMLAGLAIGDLDEARHDEVEEHVLMCSACAERYAALVRIGGEVASLVRAGGTTIAITPALLGRLEAEQLVSRRYVLTPGAVVPCSVGIADVYSLTTLEADLAGIERVDVIRGGQRLTDVPFGRERVMLLTPSAVIRTLPTMKIPFALVAVARDGSEQRLAEFTLDHTASSK